MSKSLQTLNRKRKANHKLSKQKNLKDLTEIEFNALRDSGELKKICPTAPDSFKDLHTVKEQTVFSDKNKHKATSCTKQRGLSKKANFVTKFIDTKHLNVLPRKQKKAAKKQLLSLV